MDSDGTLILTSGDGADRGTALTMNLATKLGKPCISFELNNHPKPEAVIGWLKSNRIGILNVAGPRESSSPGIHTLAATFLAEVLSRKLHSAAELDLL